ncbi:MAG: dihydropteroate synthase [Paracoccus denitrificans]|nr:MAG: dihydropteroate synthase [Paracoccus denitrificans]PZO85339.1 MAG: dihydropteroate synthase [Paracoccus denitrificans]
MTDGVYFRPIPDPAGRWLIGGGWARFSQLEKLTRNAPPEIVTHAPDEWMQAVTSPRPDILGLSMDGPRIMGIVNVTPDSFSDGGDHAEAGAGAAHGRALIAQGADILDIGGESTRPGAAEVTVVDEKARVVPVLAALAGQAVLSIDTRKSDVARAAVSAGAGMVNDVSAFAFDAGMPVVVAETGATVCLMHAQGEPATMQDAPHYDDVLLDVYDALAARISQAEAAGIPRARIVVDPGIGFGKTIAHNLTILRRLSLFHGLGCPVMLGVSRKGFLGKLTNTPDAADRDAATLAVTLAAVSQGIQIHRVHDVATTRQGIRMWQAMNKDEA